METQDNIYENSSNIFGINRLRGTKPVRQFMATYRIEPRQIIVAVLVTEEHEVRFDGLPTVTIDKLGAYAISIQEQGIHAVKLFTKSTNKSKDAAEAICKENLSLRAIKAVKEYTPNMCVITDTCLCSYTENGDCVLRDNNGILDVKKSFDILSTHALMQVEAGADILGPAIMAEGAIRAIRDKLNNEHKNHVPIMPHLTLRTALYRGYRERMDTGNGEQRQAFQIDPIRTDQYLSMAKSFLSEGADILMMQPSLFSFDLISYIKEKTGVMTGVFSVSGEYMMFKNTPYSQDMFYEHATAAIRAGADFIVTYGGLELARFINEKS